MSLKLLYSWLKRKLGLVSLKTLLYRQTKTIVFNKDECITKFMTLGKILSLVFSLFRRRCPLSLFCLSDCDLASVYIYIDKSHVPTNFLVNAGLNLNPLERALRLNVPEHFTNIEIAKLGRKHITSLLSG